MKNEQLKLSYKTNIFLSGVQLPDPVFCFVFLHYHYVAFMVNKCHQTALAYV